MRGIFLVLETNHIRQPERQLLGSSYNHSALKTLRTSMREPPPFMEVLYCICNDSFTDVLRVVEVLWFTVR